MDYHTSSNLTIDDYSNSTLYEYEVDTNGYSNAGNVFLLAASAFLFFVPIASFALTVRSRLIWRHNRTSDQEKSILSAKQRKIFLEVILISRKFSRNNSSKDRNSRDVISADAQNEEESLPVLGDMNNDEKSQLVSRNTNNDEENPLVPQDMEPNWADNTYPLDGWKEVEENKSIASMEHNSQCSQIAHNESDNARKVDFCASDEERRQEEIEGVTDNTNKNDEYAICLSEFRESEEIMQTKLKMDVCASDEERRPEGIEDITDTTNKNDECAICLSEFCEGEEIMQTKRVEICNHVFHKACLMAWLDNHNQCPMCRHEMVTHDDMTEAIQQMLTFVERDGDSDTGGLPTVMC